MTTTRRPLYGPTGWTTELGIWPLLANHLDTHLHPDHPEDLRTSMAAGTPDVDYIPLHGIDATTAKTLLDVLPTTALNDRQNLAPTLRTLLTACATANDQVHLSGYGISPKRPDERLSIDTIWIADPDLLEIKVHPQHRHDCQCDRLWAEIASRYHLDSLSMPDEILHTRPEWAPNTQELSLWWD